jgi:hypothetical protein
LNFKNSNKMVEYCPLITATLEQQLRLCLQRPPTSIPIAFV